MKNIQDLISFSKPLHVLYVEDDISIRDNYAKVFGELFERVDLADDGVAGLEKFQSSHYDIIITDINMPRMNGIDMTSKILEEDPEQLIIITSAHDESSYLLQLIELGIEKFLIKPVDFKKMISVLHKTCKSLDEKRELLEYQKNIEDENISISALANTLKKKNIELEKTIKRLTQEENVTITLVDGIEKEKKFSEEELEFYAPNMDKVSALDFVTHYTGNIENLSDRLGAIEETMELNIHQKLSSPTSESVDELSTAFLDYSKQLSLTFKFKNLSEALEQFSHSLSQVKDLNRLKEMSAFLFGISDSLQRFRAEVLVEHSAEDIHFLDNSIISDCLQTQSMLGNAAEEEIDMDDMFF